MLRNLKGSASLLLLLAVAAPLPALAEEAPHPAGDAPAAAETDAAVGPIQKLVQQRKFDEAILEVKKLREAAKKPLADAESEFWAARAENGLKQTEAARQRFQAIAKAYPDTDRGIAAAIEATTVKLATLSSIAKTPEEKKIASDCALELEATAARLKDKPEGQARAFYVAGNAWRTAGEIEKSIKDYETVRKMQGAGDDYPAKAVQALAVYKARAFDVEGAANLYTECAKRFPEASATEKCNKGLARLRIVGSPAPELKVETWLNSEPQDLAKLKGNVVLVWFFATWCPHCKETMPEVAGLVEQFKGKPFKVIGITNNTRDQTTETAKAFVADPQWKITYPAGVDKGGASSLDWEASGIPSAVLVDKKGIVRWADHPVYLEPGMIERLMAE